MLKMSILIDCDGCHQLFPFSCFASDDQAASLAHGKTLIKMAEENGWVTSECGGAHQCPQCWDALEREVLQLLLRGE